MASVNLGRVAMVHRGDYNLLLEYKPLDCCYHQGSTYLCKAESVGNAPPNAAYWVLMSTSASTVDREAAEAAALEALGYKNQAAAQVDLAADQVALAAEHVETAAGHVTAAQGKVDLAAAQVALAEQHAVAAGTSEVNAATSETNAANSATAASTSETNAAASATAAQQAAASVDGPGLLAAIRTHPHDGSVEGGVRIHYSNLDGMPTLAADNLLHNWDFRNPVNQRNVSGVISATGYFYDRWKLNSGSVTTNSAYLTIGAGAVIEQRIEGNLLAGQTVTVSVMDSGTVYSGTGVFPTSAGTVSVTIAGWGTATIGYDTGYMYLRLSPAEASNVEAVKLELGTVSTLNLDPPADYEIEYLKCRRYYRRIRCTAAYRTILVLLTQDSSNRTIHQCGLMELLGYPQRLENPSVLYYGLLVRDFTDNSSKTITEIAVSGGSCLQVKTTQSAQIGGAVALFSTDASAYIDFSSEL